MVPLCCKSSSLITHDYRGIHWAHGQSVIRHRVGLASVLLMPVSLPPFRDVLPGACLALPSCHRSEAQELRGSQSGRLAGRPLLLRA